MANKVGKHIKTIRVGLEMTQEDNRFRYYFFYSTELMNLVLNSAWKIAEIWSRVWSNMIVIFASIPIPQIIFFVIGCIWWFVRK